MRLLLSSLIVLLLLAGITVRAEEAPLWKSVRGWDVRVDTNLNNGCFMIGFFEGGTAFRLGIDRENKAFYMLIGNKNWSSIELGKEYTLEFQFDKKDRWTSEFTGIEMGDPSPIFLYASGFKSEVIVEFMKQQGMNIFYRGNRIAGISLRGSYRAMMEVIDCQREFDSQRFGGSNSGSRSDPFRSAPRKNYSDPFSQ